MKYLGIDYGKRRTGLATSSEDGSIAFPFTVLETSPNLANDIAQIIDNESIGKVVIGESKDTQNNDNVIMKDVREFIGQLSLLTSVPIDLQREDFTTSAAQQQMVPEKNVTRSRVKKPIGDNDAMAAAIILQRYLDKNNKS